LEGLACRLAAPSGIPEEAAATLRACVAEGDRYLPKGFLAEVDFRPYQAMNVTFHETILKLSGNVWA
ncbi:FCD domain-containing protein, partial [Acinetobacter baumannii]|uniref:FCD domain-containing protein n=1 Tax=Acinetobacter baumannii TaxID=470 RepID=UPI0013D8A640